MEGVPGLRYEEFEVKILNETFKLKYYHPVYSYCKECGVYFRQSYYVFSKYCPKHRPEEKRSDF
jgi:uncharacterized OB-fold protein